MDALKTRIEKRAASGRDNVPAPILSWKLSLPRDHYAGSYCSPDYGTMFVSTERDGFIRVALGNLRAVAAPSEAMDSATVEMLPMQASKLSFDVRDGAVLGVEVMGWQFARCDR
jgi:hypothetical protein